MLIGQTIFLPDDEVFSYFGPWFPRQGDVMTVVFEVLNASSGSGWTIDVFVETKNAEDTDAAVTTYGPLTVSAVGTSQLLISACLELVRYRYEINRPTGDKWVHCRANPPIWQPN